MARRKEEEEKFLDVSAAMQGSLAFSDPVNLRINGKFEGTLTTKGKLVVGRNADVKADIIGENVMVFIEDFLIISADLQVWSKVALKPARR